MSQSKCGNCGNDITNAQGYCPHCGTRIPPSDTAPASPPVQPPQNQAPPYHQAPQCAQPVQYQDPYQQRKELHVLSLVFAILGLTILPLIGSIVALVTGYSNKETHDTKASIILGWIGIGLGILGIILIC